MTAAGAEVPSPNAGDGASGSASNRKWQAFGIFAFLLTIVVLAIVLGTTLGGSDDDESGSDETASSSANNNDENVGTKEGSFVWFTDVHYDQYYGTPRAAFHGGSHPSCPGYERNNCNSTDSPKYSIYGCGASRALVESFLSEASRVTGGKPDFVLFTGDATRHFADDLGEEDAESTVHNAITYLYNTTKEYFPDVPVYQLPPIVQGNNDWSPHDVVNITSYDACIEGENGEPPKATNEHLQDAARNNEEVFADKMEEAIFACGGYTRREVVPDLVVISLNTMLWGVNLNKKYNQGNPNNELHVPDHYTEDPFGQLQWLKDELSKARAGGKKVYIVGHHPPADQSVIVLAGEDLWKQGFQLRYEHIVSEFSDVVAAQMFGHVHTNEFRRMPHMPSGSAPLMLQGAIAPGYCMNPNFSIVKYDGSTKAPSDMSKYFGDVKEAFGTDSRSRGELTWNEEVKSVVDLFGMEHFTNDEVLGFANRALDDKSLWNSYWNTYTKGRAQETDCLDECVHQEVCVIACGTRREKWYSCVIGYGDCTVGNDSYLGDLSNLGDITD